MAGHRILVVDDEKPIVRIIKTNLEAEGYETDCAYDGIEALERVQAARPALILLDVMMPRMDGWSVLREIKQNPETEPIIVVMLTALTDAVHIDRALRELADAYLTKPFDPGDLIALVGRFLAALDEQDLYDEA